jgi:AraC-like DNA-binding protein
VLLTSRSVVESQLQGLAKGADDYLTKPFQFRFLQARIKNLLEQRERLQQHFLTMLKERPVLLTPNESSNHDAAFLQKIVQTIEENIADVNFNVDRLEVALSMSKMQLYRKLTSLTGMSGNAFIRHIRLMRAKQLLENNSLTVAEVAYQVGFNSPSYFTRAFKKEFGKLPSSTSVRLN